MVDKNQKQQGEQAKQLQQREVKVQGRQSFVDLLQNIDFPASKEEVMRDAEQVELIWRGDDPITLQDVLIELHEEQFNSMEDLVDAICSMMRMAFADYSAVNQEGVIQR
jgi:hypothetical protein